MSRTIILTVSLCAVGFLSLSASAQQYCTDGGDFCQQSRYDYYRNKMWPLPFRAQDTRAVLDHFAVQRNNGWKLHNTIGASMFDPITQQLTDSGKAQVRWIVTRAPLDRRVVFVLQGDAPNQTAARVESTQLAISEIIPVGPLPQLYVTDQDAPGSSGVYQTAITRAMQTSVPAPRLTAAPQTP
ncbi:MAG: hypothetical protein KDA51_20960 [Planctomycetales bacterium]|nr:hypothetical protein [Planctomycetales bacterium]